MHKAKLRKQKISRKQRKRATACSQYMLGPGDDISSIAREHNVLVSDIERLNAGDMPVIHCMNAQDPYFGVASF